MKAIILKHAENKNQLEVQEISKPTPKEDEVLVKVRVIGINPVDVKTVAGNGIYSMLKNEDPIILGWDISGEIVELGSNAQNFKKGDEVFGMVNFPGHGKTYAEFVAVPQNQLALKPQNISHEEAAASCLAALTAWQALVHTAKIKEGDRVLIHAASGGVGHFAVQIAKHFGDYVIGTSSTKNRDFVLSLGADEHIDYKTQRFEKMVSDIDIVLDAIGGDYIERSLKIMKKGGVIINLPSGFTPEQQEKARKRKVNCESFYVRSNGEDLALIADLLGKGAVKAHVSQVYPFEQMEEAHRQIASGRTVGKVLVTV